MVFVPLRGFAALTSLTQVANHKQGNSAVNRRWRWNGDDAATLLEAE
jgi:hypothetical protein